MAQDVTSEQGHLAHGHAEHAPVLHLRVEVVGHHGPADADLDQQTVRGVGRQREGERLPAIARHCELVPLEAPARLVADRDPALHLWPPGRHARIEGERELLVPAALQCEPRLGPGPAHAAAPGLQPVEPAHQRRGLLLDHADRADRHPRAIAVQYRTMSKCPSSQGQGSYSMFRVLYWISCRSPWSLSSTSTLRSSPRSQVGSLATSTL